MHLIDTPNAAVGGQFQDAAPGVGQQATFLNAAWCNMLQNELATIVTGGGLALQTAGTDTADQVMKAMVNIVRPIGSQYITYDDSHTPNMLWPWQTWIEIAQGRVIVGRDVSQTEFAATAQTGGAKTVALTADQIPAHDHTPSDDGNGTGYGLIPTTVPGANKTQDSTDSANSGIEPNIVDPPKAMARVGGGQPHTNLQPYLVARIWKRSV